MKNRLISLLALLVLAPFAANAIPIKYEITFAPNALDADGGVGSFFRDDTTHLLSQLTWDFGGGNTGGVNDAVTDWAATIFGDSLSDWVFEILTGQDVHPTLCGSGGVTCSTGYDPAHGLLGYPGGLIVFAFGTAFGPDLHTYAIKLADGTEARAAYSTRLATVPESGTLGLLALSLFVGGIWIQRRGRRTLQ